MKMRAEQGVAGYAPQVARPQNADVQRQKILKNYGEITTATVTEKK